MWIIKLPLKVPVSKKRDFILNLNQYRNTYFQTLNKAKANFEEIVAPRLRGIPKLGQVDLLYTVYPQTKQLFDISNVGSIVDKFFCDTLTGAGILEDDNYKFVVSVRYKFGGVDKANPRVEATITPIGDLPQNQKEEDMQIILVQAEVEQAIKDYISQRLTLSEGTNINIDLSATRGANGITATIDLVPATAPVEAAPAKTTEKQPTTRRAVAPAAPVVTAEATTAAVTTEAASEAATTTQEAGTATEAGQAEAGTTQTQTEDAAPAAPAKSLFGGLKKPVNQ